MEEEVATWRACLAPPCRRDLRCMILSLSARSPRSAIFRHSLIHARRHITHRLRKLTDV